MKIYISVPIVSTKKHTKTYNTIQKFLKRKGHDTNKMEVGGENIFQRDYEDISESNVLIAIISDYSHGVGIELGLSYFLCEKRICCIDSKSKVSIGGMIRDMPNTKIIKYGDKSELLNKISRELDT